MKLNKNKIVAFIESHIVSYGTASNLNYVWSFGALAGAMLVVQIISGLLMCLHYIPDTKEAFESIVLYTRNGNYGWAIRYLHSNGASFFFAIVYAHILKALYYGSYYHPREKVWFTGLAMYLLMMATAFIGYVLPWGQMSLWGATVITNLFTSIPFIGEAITKWLWGGYSVGGPTLVRFAGLHYVLPWILVALTLTHLSFLHQAASNNPIGTEKVTVSSFFPYFGLKDLHAVLVLMTILALVITFIPNYLGHTDNYIPANPFVTPKHIVPEWYFLPFYAILRSIPHKVGGVVAMGGAILVLFFLPVLNTSRIRNTYFRPIYSIFLGFFVVDFILLGWVGQLPVEHPYDSYGLYFTIYYYFFFLIFLPLSGKIESWLIANNLLEVECGLENETSLLYKKYLSNCFQK
jgi:ubiquinol-cytochrome c reductase cytochrome b subunit